MEHPSQQTYAADEIDPYEPIVTLCEAKWLILVVTLFFTGAAVAYAFLRAPVFEAVAQTLPPASSGLAGYNIAHQLTGPALTTIDGSNSLSNKAEDTSPKMGSAPSDNSVPELTPHDAYAVFLRHLGSASLRRWFFDKFYLPAHPSVKSNIASERLWNRLEKKLTIEIPKAGSGDERAKITFDGENPSRIANWTNQYLREAIKNSQNELLTNLKSATNLRRLSVDDQIATLREVAQKNRESEITRLEHALALAKAIDLNSPPSSGNLITSYTGATTYLRGSKALNAELQLLKKRSSDDPYIPELPNLLKIKTLLTKVDLDPRKLSVVTIDQMASPPEIPIKPKKQIVILLGIVLGLIVGSALAFARQIWRKISRSRAARHSL